jgi:hypothetical protein
MAGGHEILREKQHAKGERASVPMIVGDETGAGRSSTSDAGVRGPVEMLSANTRLINRTMFLFIKIP